ncbi:MAG: transposase [Candidatus Dormiibacterota bacterium]
MHIWLKGCSTGERRVINWRVFDGVARVSAWVVAAGCVVAPGSAGLGDGALRESDPGYRALLRLPGVGPVFAAILRAEIGEITRFPSPGQLSSWAGLTPRHRESDTTIHRGRITSAPSTQAAPVVFGDQDRRARAVLARMRCSFPARICSVWTDDAGCPR